MEGTFCVGKLVRNGWLQQSCFGEATTLSLFLCGTQRGSSAQIPERKHLKALMPAPKSGSHCNGEDLGTFQIDHGLYTAVATYSAYPAISHSSHSSWSLEPQFCPVAMYSVPGEESQLV